MLTENDFRPLRELSQRFQELASLSERGLADENFYADNVDAQIDVFNITDDDREERDFSSLVEFAVMVYADDGETYAIEFADQEDLNEWLEENAGSNYDGEYA